MSNSDEEEVEHINKKQKLVVDETESLSTSEKTVGYNRCRKPLPKKSKCSSTSLRKIAACIVTKFNNKYSVTPKLTTDDRVCNACRKLLADACESSQEMESEAKTSTEDFSQHVLSDVSDFIEDEINVVEVPVNKLQQFKDLLEIMQKKFHDVNATKQEKLQILTLLPLNWSVKEIQDYFKASSYTITLAKKLHKEKGPMSSLCARRGSCFDGNTNIIVDFYKSEDNCYILPGMKDCVKSKDNEGNPISEQKRLLLCTLKELYLSFKTVNPNTKIGFSSFAKFRPKCCLLAGSSGTHSVCVCSIHQNVKLLILGCSLEKVTEKYSVTLKTYKDVLNFVICEKNASSPSSTCYLGECTDCPGVNKLKEYLTKVFEENDIEVVNYSQWVTTPITTLKNLTDDIDEFINCFCEKIEKLLPHAFISSQQSDYYKTLKLKINYNEAIVNLDFVENYAFIVQDAPPGFHWNNNQATVFVSFIYYKEQDSNEVKSKGFVVISDNLNHDTVAVFTYQQLLINYIKKNFPAINQLHYFTDGAPQQFKNFKNVINLCQHNTDFGMKADWNFFPTAHGKGACDGVGGSVKRTAAKASLRLPPEKQILTASALYNWLKDHGNFTNVDFEFSVTTDYNKNVRKLDQRFTNKNRIKNLQNQHYLMPLENGKVIHKIFSNSLQSKKTKIN